MKDIIFAGNSLKALKALPTEARREAGYQLDKIQHGEDPADWKPLQGIGIGVRELRIRESNGTYRVIYIAKFEEAVYVLHAFAKKTQRTAKIDIEIAKQSLKDILQER